MTRDRTLSLNYDERIEAKQVIVATGGMFLNKALAGILIPRWPI